jgi:hypothetical protein
VYLIRTPTTHTSLSCRFVDLPLVSLTSVCVVTETSASRTVTLRLGCRCDWVAVETAIYDLVQGQTQSDVCRIATLLCQDTHCQPGSVDSTAPWTQLRQVEACRRWVWSCVFRSCSATCLADCFRLLMPMSSRGQHGNAHNVRTIATARLECRYLCEVPL